MLPKIPGFEILQHLASGGMGRVYLARSLGPAGFERHVVLKTFDIDADNDDPRVAMFLDEARVIARMHHQHIAPAFAVGQDDEGRYFLVMDYIHGCSAAAAWERTLDLESALPLDFAVTVVAATAAALHYAHTRLARDGTSLSIIHRDVSLSNLMLGFDGAVKLIDFGIAKSADASTMTQVGFVKGKVGYMAPEQFAGGAIDRRTDIFALGIVLYELSTMTRAFREETDFDTVQRIKACDYVLPSRVVPEFPRGLEMIITRALQLDPRNRYSDADAMRLELEAFAHRQRLVTGDSAVIEVMAQLFENRAEPWLAEDGAPSELYDNNSTIPIDTTIEPSPRKGTPRPLVHHLRAASEIIELVNIKQPRDDTPTTVHQAPPRSLPAARHGSPLKWLVVLVVVAAPAGWLLYDSFAREPASSAAPARDASIVRMSAPDAGPPDGAIGAAIDATPSTIRVRITTTPADATVLLDGEKLGHTPLEIEMPPSSGTHVIKLRRRDYEPQRLDVTLTEDLVRDVMLQPAP